tara:strand:+ start:115 stop:900 length:786 start_codon:yes stop_codon:yes gene_type:complete
MESTQENKTMHIRNLSLAALAVAMPTLSTLPALADAYNIVLVHGMNMDGASWRPVYDILTEQGYKVSIVQEPLNGFDRDLHATQLVLDRQDGPVVLVGHSYGGVVITTAGNDPKVEALVYVAAFQPAAGETTGTLNAATPPQLDPASVTISEDGFVSISEDGFLKDIAPDLPVVEARFLFSSQTPTTASVFTAETHDPAWLHKPSYAVLATEDRVINPELQRMMYERAGSLVTEIDAGHLVYVSQPEAVAQVIIEAAQSAD